MMRCDAAQRLNHRAFDGEATAEERALLDEHCAACARCAAARRDLVDLRGLVRDALRAPPAAEVRAAFDRRLTLEEERDDFWEVAGRLARPWIRVAAAVVVAVGGAAGALAWSAGARETAPTLAATSARDLILAGPPMTTDRVVEIALTGVPR